MTQRWCGYKFSSRIAGIAIKYRIALLVWAWVIITHCWYRHEYWPSHVAMTLRSWGSGYNCVLIIYKISQNKTLAYINWHEAGIPRLPLTMCHLSVIKIWFISLWCNLTHLVLINRKWYLLPWQPGWRRLENWWSNHSVKTIDPTCPRPLYLQQHVASIEFFPRSRTRGIVSAVLMLIHIDVSYEIPGIHSDDVVVAVVWARLLGMPCSARPRPVQISRGLTQFLTQIATEPARCTNREQ